MLSDSELRLSVRSKLHSLADNLRDDLNVLVVCISQSWGGLEQVAAADAIDLARYGIRVRLLCLDGSPIAERLANTEGVSLEKIGFSPRNTLDFSLRKVLKRLVHEGVNIIHTHQPSLLGSIIPWVYRYRNVVVLASRHIMNTHIKRDPFHALLFRRLDALIVMSEALRMNVLATHSIPSKKVRVIHLGLDYQIFDPERVEAKRQRAKWGADDETVVIGMVGRIDPAKGQATFIKAAAGLVIRSKANEKFKFVIVGEETRGVESGYLEELHQMVKDFKLEGIVHFAGFQENIPEVMTAFDVFVMPSRQEAFGLVAIEAMAMECPILLSKGGSAYEIVGRQEFGLLIRPEDAFDLQRQLRALLDDPEMRIKMGKKARAHVMLNYDKNIRLYRTLELYERCLHRRELRNQM